MPFAEVITFSLETGSYYLFWAVGWMIKRLKALVLGRFAFMVYAALSVWFDCAERC
jgi:hypothetical protein